MERIHAPAPPAQARPSADSQRVSEETDNSVNSYIIELMERSSQGTNDRASAERSSAERPRRSGERPRTSAERTGSTPFGDPLAQSTPIPRDSLDSDEPRRSAEQTRPGTDSRLDSVDERFATRNPIGVSAPPNNSLSTQPSPGTRMAAFHDYRQQIGTRGAFSLEQPRPPRPPRATPAASPSSELRISMDLPAHIGAQMGRPPDEVVRARLTRQRRRLPLPFVIGFGIVSSAALCVGLITLSIGLYNFTKLRQNRAAKSIQSLEDDLQPVFRNMSASIAAVQTGVDVLLALGGRPRGGSPP